MILSKFILLFNDTDFFRGNIKQDESLAAHSTMHAGGTAGLLLEPFDDSSLIFALDSAQKNSIPSFLLGGGSNVIFPDGGLDLVISTRKLNVTDGVKSAGETKISCPAGSSWGSVLAFCKKNNLGGFEPFTSLSGTVGGALFMNATCFGLSACDNLLTVKYYDTQKCGCGTYSMNPADWGYKKSPFRQKTAGGGASGKKIILSAEFSVKKGFDAELSEEIKQKRIEMGHFKAASAGSAFKNVPSEGIIAGKLIDECGFKGFVCGGAQIAPWHANFIINPEQKATSADIEKLVEIVQQKVKKEKNILLEPEIIFA